uniref:Uncharacterized protein n=1 Tax=Parascaris univalens TaxID=6257 RepID=A0A915CKL5_PARUN
MKPRRDSAPRDALTLYKVRPIASSTLINNTPDRKESLQFMATLLLDRDAVNEMALHFLAKMKIMVVKDIEREDIEFYSRILGCRPVASIDHFVPDALGSADLVEEIATSGDGKVIE